MANLPNLYEDIPASLESEQFDTIIENVSFRLERIVSAGHATAAGEWYDQDHEEWVLLVTGTAIVRFEGETEDRHLRPGDYLSIPAHRRHRVESTDPAEKT